MTLKEIFNNLNPRVINSEYAVGKEEDLHLEFKTIKPGFNSKDDKKNFAKLLSAFANSDGGIVIWGITARKNSDGIDCSTGIILIKNLKQVLAKLNEYTGEFVSPIVNRVEHKLIELSSNEGVIATIIPVSDSGPHMAKAGENRYYKRSGDSTYVMEHFDIEDMFGRRRKPVLELSTFIKSGITTSSGNKINRECIIVIGIKNNGRGIAKYPSITLCFDDPYKLDRTKIRGTTRYGIPLLMSETDKRIKKFGGGADDIIHPETILEVTRISCMIPKSLNNIPDLAIEYKIYSDSISIVAGNKVISAKEIADNIFSDLK